MQRALALILGEQGIITIYGFEKATPIRLQTIRDKERCVQPTLAWPSNTGITVLIISWLETIRDNKGLNKVKVHFEQEMT